MTKEETFVKRSIKEIKDTYKILEGFEEDVETRLFVFYMYILGMASEFDIILDKDLTSYHPIDKLFELFFEYNNKNLRPEHVWKKVNTILSKD